MHFPQEVYAWLVKSNIISNAGQQDQKGLITLPPQIANNFDNGFLVGEIIRKITTENGKKVPSALSTVKSDSSKNTKLTNWNFIWLAFDAIELKLDTRIKELILQGEQALIVEVVRQLHEKSNSDEDQNTDKINIKMKQLSTKSKTGTTQVLDVKKINLNKDPEESESSLQFLMLLLKSSLGMNLEEILGLFTNQNKYLAHIIVKGLNDNFDAIILFYSLLNKHSNKLKLFYEQDNRDAEACLYALKPGFISKNQKVAQLAVELFGKLGNIYNWFVGDDSKCSGTLLLGLKRHPDLRQLYWILLLQIIEGEEIQYFTKFYDQSFQNTIEQIEITTFLLKFISQSFLGQKLTAIGIISSWLQLCYSFAENNLNAQVICFKFIGQLMLYLPQVIEQNEQSMQIMSKSWKDRNLPQFVTIFNELIVILQKLGEGKNTMARKIYLVISQIAKDVGAGDKRDYLVENFLPLIAKFPTIPSEYLIQHLKRHPLSASQFLLICQSIEINQNTQTLVSVAIFLKNVFLQNPLLNFYLTTLLKEIVQKVMNDEESGMPYLQKLVEESLQLFANLEIKYKPRPKQQQSMYFGRKGSPEKSNKQSQQDHYIKQKWKQILLALNVSLIDLAFSQENQEIKQFLKEKIMNCNSYVRLNNHKVGSKPLEDILYKRFGISKQVQVEHSQQFKTKVSQNIEDSTVRKSKASYVSVKLKGPQNLIKEFNYIAQKRKQEEQQRKAIELKKQLIEQKKKLNVKKQLEITNLLRGQIGQAQIRQQGFLQRLMHSPKELEVIYLDQLQTREVQAINAITKRYHKVLRHIFLTFTATMYSSHTNQRFEDNQQRKQTLTAVELGRLLKEYKLLFLTSQLELNGLVRDINVKLLNKRQVNQLDFHGFQQFIIQFCALIMTRNHSITTNINQIRTVSNKKMKNQPIYMILKDFFTYLKSVFVAKGQKLAVFQDVNDITLSKQQAYEIDIFNQKLIKNPAYILPKDYKKISQNVVDFEYKISNSLSCFLPEQYIVAIQTLDYILSQDPLNIHIIQDIAIKKTVYKIKPTALASNGLGEFPRERAMSTFIERKAPLLELEFTKKRSTSKGILSSLKKMLPNQRKIGQQAAIVLQDMVEKVQKISTSKQKEVAKQKKIISFAKLQQIQKIKAEILQKRSQQKQQAGKLILKKEKQQERKRRQQTQKFLDQQRQKLTEKKKRQEEERQKKYQQLEQKKQQKQENKQKFKIFHEGQVEKIKKMSENVIEKIKRQKEEEEQEKERQEQLRRRLRQKIQQDDKKIIQQRKQVQKKIQSLFESEQIKKTYAKYQPNLKAVYDFLIRNTFLSLTEKKHNNQIIFDTWKMFISSFELSIILQPKDSTFIFKSITRDKLVSKEYYIGLNFNQFQLALLRIAIKYKTIFNLISQKIKDQIEEPPKDLKPESKVKQPKKSVKKGKSEENTQDKKQSKKQKSKQKIQKLENEFDKIADVNIKEIIKENNNGRDSIEEFGDVAKVNQKTLIGLIYYLKVPSNKVGQEKRFKQILEVKQTSSIQNTQRLKQRLSQQYSLQSSPNKIGNNVKVEQSGSGSVKSK